MQMLSDRFQLRFRYLPRFQYWRGKIMMSCKFTGNGSLDLLLNPSVPPALFRLFRKDSRRRRGRHPAARHPARPDGHGPFRSLRRRRDLLRPRSRRPRVRRTPPHPTPGPLPTCRLARRAAGLPGAGSTHTHKQTNKHTNTNTLNIFGGCR